jgi:hypothetical protein
MLWKHATAVAAVVALGVAVTSAGVMAAPHGFGGPGGGNRGGGGFSGPGSFSRGHFSSGPRNFSRNFSGPGNFSRFSASGGGLASRFPVHHSFPNQGFPARPFVNRGVPGPQFVGRPGFAGHYGPGRRYGFTPGYGYGYYTDYDDCLVLTDYGWINTCGYNAGYPAGYDY